MADELKKRLLFVDDEEQVLQGLRLRLRRQRRKWKMSFAVGGRAALEHLERSSFDVIVTDMRMPGMDGNALLKEVKERSPETIRIVLSGHIDENQALKAVPLAHRFLAKPCESGRLEAVIDEVFRVQKLLNNPALQSRLAAIGDLPTLGRVYRELQMLMRQPGTTSKRIATLIEQAPAICVRLLQLANSAMFGLPERIKSIEHAVTFLGFDMVKDLVFMVDVFTTFEKLGIPPGFSIRETHAHSLRVARLSQRLLQGTPHAQEAFIAGLLHDLGRTLIAIYFKKDWMRLRSMGVRGEMGISRAEKRVMGFTHAEVGGYLLSIWGLPFSVVSAVTYHHMPSLANPDGFDLVTAVHLADWLIHDAEIADPDMYNLDLELMTQLDLFDRLDEWKGWAQEENQRSIA